MFFDFVLFFSIFDFTSSQIIIFFHGLFSYLILGHFCEVAFYCTLVFTLSFFHIFFFLPNILSFFFTFQFSFPCCRCIYVLAFLVLTFLVFSSSISVLSALMGSFLLGVRNNVLYFFFTLCCSDVTFYFTPTILLSVFISQSSYLFFR